MTKDPNRLSLIDAANALSSGTLTPHDLLQSCLDRISKREDAVGAWMQINTDGASMVAKNPTTGPLSGIPIGVKDLIDTVDMPTGYGSTIYAAHRPAQDAACVSILRNAGGNILGKTVSTEFAYFQPGKTANPHDRNRTPGGSSSGSAAAVADYHVPAALGTQTAGSIIRPASFCGVVGYKPTYGYLPLTGIRPLAPSMDHLGVLTRTVADAGFLASILGRRPGLDIRSSTNYSVPKIGFCQSRQWDHAETTTQSLLSDAATKLGKAGATMCDVELPLSFETLAAAHGLAMDYEVSFTGLFDVTNHPKQVSEKFRERFDAGQKVSSVDYDTALSMALRARVELRNIMGDCDVLICPSAPGEAPLGLDATGDPVFNRMWTFTGVPCVNIPGLTGPNGMPVGLQVVGRFGDDARVLKVAAWIEKNLPNKN